MYSDNSGLNEKLLEVILRHSANLVRFCIRPMSRDRQLEEMEETIEDEGLLIKEK